MTGGQAHAIAATVLAEAGYGDRFTHGLGHGVGLDIHEAPRLSADSEDLLEDGQVVTPSSRGSTFRGGEACASRISA